MINPNLAHTYLYSLFTYSSFLLEPSEAFYKDFQGIIKAFLWPNKSKVSMKRLCQTKEDAGIGLKDPKILSASLHTSVMLRILSEKSTLAKAISEHYFQVPGNRLAHPKHYKFKSPMSWLSRFFKAFPEPLDSNYGAYVYPEISSKFILLKINELRIIKVKDKIGQTVNQSLTIKEPNSPAVPIPFIFLEKEVTHREDMLFLTADLTDLKAGFFSPSPSLQQLYLNQMQILKPSPPLSESTKQKLAHYGFDVSIFGLIWKLRVRPYLKGFLYLFLLNSLPLFHGKPCIGCGEPLHQNHLFTECSFFSSFVPSSVSPITQWLIRMASLWLTFTKNFHDNSFHPIFSVTLFESILESETIRVQNMIKAT